VPRLQPDQPRPSGDRQGALRAERRAGRSDGDGKLDGLPLPVSAAGAADAAKSRASGPVRHRHDVAVPRFHRSGGAVEDVRAAVSA
jgi:hypothetical protein